MPGASLMRYFPSKLQVFGSEEECAIKPAAPWNVLSAVSSIHPRTHYAVTIPELRLVSCLKITLLEMNAGNTIKIGNMVGRAKPAHALHHIVMRDWQGASPNLSTYCDNQVPYMQNSGQDQCQGRNKYSLYKFFTGFDLCQCDALCLSFADCCHDYRPVPSGPTEMGEDSKVECLSVEFPVIVRAPDFGFFLITSCKADYLRTEMAAKCLYGMSQSWLASDILSKNPVDANGISYRNVYCALCNGESLDDITYWQYRTEGSVPDFCEQQLTVVKQNLTTTGLDIVCFPPGTFRSNTYSHQGQTRLGKLCVKPTLRSSIHRETSLSQRPPYPIAVLMHQSSVEVVDSNCLCQNCEQRVFPYVTTDMTRISFMLQNPDKPFLFADHVYGSHSGSLTGMFRSKVDKEEKSPTPEDEQSSVIVSPTGGVLSIFFLSIIGWFHLRDDGLKSDAKRCQLGIILAKWLFFVALCGGVAVRNWEKCCVFFAVMVHHAILASFGQVIWFGMKVARLLWYLNHDMGAVSAQNGDKSVTAPEVALFLMIWLGSALAVMGFWAYEKYMETAFFVYGRERDCLMTGEGGRLYFIVVPASIMVVMNLFCMVFSIFQFRHFFNNQASHNMAGKFMGFLGKLIVFQSMQWIFGIVHYFTHDRGSKYAFEALVAFEGLFLFISYFSRKFRAWITARG